MATTYTNTELANINGALAALSKIQLPVTAAFAVARSITETTRVMEAFDKVRMDLVKQHAEKDDEGEPRTENDEYVMLDRPAFDADFDILLAQETEIVFPSITEKDLQGITLAPAILVPLLGTMITAPGATATDTPAPAKKTRAARK